LTFVGWTRTTKLAGHGIAPAELLGAIRSYSVTMS
jgi:hypothetical protein